MTVGAWKAVGAAVCAAAIGAGGVLVSARAAPAGVAKDGQAITVADITAVRVELQAIQADTNKRFETLDQRLSHLEGYVAGSEKRRAP